MRIYRRDAAGHVHGRRALQPRRRQPDITIQLANSLQLGQIDLTVVARLEFLIGKIIDWPVRTKALL